MGACLEQEQKLRAEIAALLERAEAADLAEDEQYGPDGSGEDVPEELKRRRSRLQAIERAKQRLEQKARDRDDQRGRSPEDDGPPRRGPRYKRPLRGTRPQGAEQLHRSRELHHADLVGGLPAGV